MSEKLNNNLAFVFPGQGSQSMGMLSELSITHVEIEEVFDCASQILGFDLWELASQGPEEKLSLTQNTQPLMLAAGVAVWRIWCNNSSIRPGWLAGHSLGEYTALVCSGAIAFEDAVRLVVERARLMVEAVPAGTGAMAAILGLDDTIVVKICEDVSSEKIVSPANFNAPGQIVIAGHKDAVDRAMKIAMESGARRALILPVSVPSHCSLMKPAAERMDAFFQNLLIDTPEIPIIHNVDVAPHAAPEVIKDALKKQLYNPVRWVETVKFMHEQGVTAFFECGPGKVLSALNKRIVRGSQTNPMYDVKTLNKAFEQVD